MPKPPARDGHCTAVGSWSPGPGRKRVPWQCKCPGWSPQASQVARDTTCVCGHSQPVHSLTPTEKDA